jgi:predicted kinase
MTTLFLICGFPFAGKTMLERALLKRVDLARVDVDDTKRQLFGAATSDAQLSQTDWTQIYAETDRQIGRYLRAGRSVADASRNFRRDERTVARQVAAAGHANLVTIFVDTPEEVVRGRLAENRIAQTRHDVPDAEFEELLRGMEPPAPDESPFVLHHGDDLDQWITRHVLAAL